MEERTDELNTSMEDSAAAENLTEETEETEDKISTEGTPEKEEHAEGREEEPSIDWEKRYKDLQSETTQLQQRVAEIDKSKTVAEKMQEMKRFEEESKKQLDVGSYIEKYKDKPSEGLNAWMDAREQYNMRNVYNMVRPLTVQTQLTQWRLAKILQEIAPEVVEKHLEKEKAIKKVLEEVPALYNYADYLDQAEKMALAKMSGKDLKQMEQKLEKDIRKSIDQQSGKSIPATKAPPKEKLSREEQYRRQIWEKGQLRTKL